MYLPINKLIYILYVESKYKKKTTLSTHTYMYIIPLKNSLAIIDSNRRTV